MRVSSLDEKKRITQAEIVSMPNKLFYAINDYFDPTGLSVRVHYADNTQELINDFEENIYEQYKITEDTTAINMYLYANNQTISLVIPISLRTRYLDTPELSISDLTISVKKIVGATGYHIYENGVFIGNLLQNGTWEGI